MIGKEKQRLVAIREGKVLLNSAGMLPAADDVRMSAAGEVFRYGNCKAHYTNDASPSGCLWVGVRDSAAYLGADWIAVAKGAELLNWAVSTRFCSVCGQPMERASEISMRCCGCGREVWPQLSPCIMVLITRGNEALLVHAATFRGPFFGLVAGFVETGETLEECVVREVKEETGLQIKNLRYCKSQSWPFPAQLMIGFRAEYAGGELRFADGELTAGGFFSRDNLPQIPSGPSLARQLIEDWLAED